MATENQKIENAGGCASSVPADASGGASAVPESNETPERGMTGGAESGLIAARYMAVASTPDCETEKVIFHDL